MGIALGGGAARGFAHVGVLEALRRAGLTADYVAGTSIGAAVGAMYSLGSTVEEMTAVLQRLGNTIGFGWRSPRQRCCPAPGSAPASVLSWATC